jgi:hypothetical protein
MPRSGCRIHEQTHSDPYRGRKAVTFQMLSDQSHSPALWVFFYSLILPDAIIGAS